MDRDDHSLALVTRTRRCLRWPTSYRSVVQTGPKWSHLFREGVALPVYGHRHEDAEIIGFAEHHYHIDWHFVGRREFALMVEFMAHHDAAFLHANIVSEKCLTSDPLTY